MQYIENALISVDTGIMAKYGGVKGTSKRLIELRNPTPVEGSIRGRDRQL